jgi:hypothetical protein
MVDILGFMNRKIVIGLFVIAVIVIGGIIIKAQTPPGGTGNTATGSPTSQPQKLTSGMKLSDSPDGAFAYKVAPGAMDVNAKAALTGWNITSTTQKDGSVAVTLTPKSSTDLAQTYTVTPGLSLYFVEKNTKDDNSTAGSDATLSDDYGVLVDASGVVQ